MAGGSDDVDGVGFAVGLTHDSPDLLGTVHVNAPADAARRWGHDLATFRAVRTDAADALSLPPPLHHWPHRSDAPNADATADACEAACCGDASCTVWTYGYRGSQKAGGNTCWVGNCVGKFHNVPNDTWVGGVRPALPPAPPAPPLVPTEARAGFDDSGWELVDAPHDCEADIPRLPVSPSPDTRSMSVHRVYGKPRLGNRSLLKDPRPRTADSMPQHRHVL